ncbi:hypothetical protein PCL_09921 [Purpureocillium lilacinum]|nr:hypothetical protein PCL_09921 [Purpureocillium lilacinum]
MLGTIPQQTFILRVCPPLLVAKPRFIRPAGVAWASPPAASSRRAALPGESSAATRTKLHLINHSFLNSTAVPKVSSTRTPRPPQPCVSCHAHDSAPRTLGPTPQWLSGCRGTPLLPQPQTNRPNSIRLLPFHLPSPSASAAASAATPRCPDQPAPQRPGLQREHATTPRPASSA